MKYLNKEHYVLVLPENYSPVLPLNCDVCDVVMYTSDDVTSYNTFGCCHHCELMWAASRKEQWLSGWRPSADDVIQNRKIGGIPITLL